MRPSTSQRHDSEPKWVLEVGYSRIPYRVRESARAVRKRIIVQPGSVEIVLPAGQLASDAHAFMREKRRWVFAQTCKLEGLTERERSYRSGSKIRFRGRWLTLEIKPGNGKAGSVEYRSRFSVTLPRSVVAAQRTRVVRALLDAWSERQLLRDGDRFTREYARKIAVDVAGVAVAPMTRMWASCGKDRIIRLNRELVELPRSVLKYVIAHEVCHCLHRNHSPAFWRAVGGLMPNWREQQAWLVSYERDWGL